MARRLLLRNHSLVQRHNRKRKFRSHKLARKPTHNQYHSSSSCIHLSVLPEALAEACALACCIRKDRMLQLHNRSLVLHRNHHHIRRSHIRR